MWRFMGQCGMWLVASGMWPMACSNHGGMHYQLSLIHAADGPAQLAWCGLTAVRLERHAPQHITINPLTLPSSLPQLLPMHLALPCVPPGFTMCGQAGTEAGGVCIDPTTQCCTADYSVGKQCSSGQLCVGAGEACATGASCPGMQA